MQDDVSINKAQIIERCLQRIHQEYAEEPSNLLNITKQDSIVLNLQRACESAIALAMHRVAEQGWGIPNTSREAFTILADHEVLPKELTSSLKAMVGFRNIAIHDYQKMNIEILRNIIETHLDDLSKFSQIMLQE